MTFTEVFPLINKSVQDLAVFFWDIGFSGRWFYFAAQGILFYFLIFLLANSYFQRSTGLQEHTRTHWFKKVIASDFLFGLALLIFIFWSRLSIALEGALNPDETQWIALAKTLAHDPRFWVSVDGGTGGPLVSFTLLTLRIFGLPIDFGTIKMMGTLMMGLSCWFLFAAFVKVFGSVRARIFVLPLVVALAVIRFPDAVAYNSEHPVILLLCISLYLLGRIHTAVSKDGIASYLLLGISLGLVPFAKLQGAPVAALIGITGCLAVGFKRKKQLLILISSGLLPALLIMSVVLLYGGWTDFWTSYVMGNLNYTSTGQTAKGFFGNLVYIMMVMYVPTELNFFVSASLVTITLGFALNIALRNFVSRQDFSLILFGIVFTVASAYSIGAPGRFFHHYMLLGLVPLTLLSAALINAVCNAAGLYFSGQSVGNTQLSIWPATFVFVTSIYFFHTRFTTEHPEFDDKIKTRASGYYSQAEVAAALKRYYVPGAKMGIWGWAYDLWAETDFVMGTRDCAGCIQPPEALSTYLLDRYVKDLQTNKPELFVEAIAPNFFAFQDRAKYGFETNPAVKKIIDENYHFEEEINGARIYLRNDWTNPRKSWVTEGLPKKIDRTEGFSHDFALTKMGSVYQFRGWMIFNAGEDSLSHQRVRCALYNATDTLLIDSYRKKDWVIVSYFNDRNFTWAGYEGYFNCADIVPKGDYSVGLYVENNGLTLLADMKKTISVSETCDAFK